MSSTWGKNIKISVFGESHGNAIGVVVDGLPAGIRLDMEEFELDMRRRASGAMKGTTPRRESDRVEFASGVVNNTLCGTPVCMMIRNENQHSGDYDRTLTLPRPSHADYTGYIRYNGFGDIRGGGHFSGRLTAPIVAAGALCRQVLMQENIHIGCHILAVGDIQDKPFDACNLDKATLETVRRTPLGVTDEETRQKMTALIEETASRGDSVGAKLECGIAGLCAGIGSPMFDGLENRIASVIFGIPAVKGIEFGMGFDFAKAYGSACNDELFYDENGSVKTYTNYNAGILGGISNGMPITFHVVIKPTPSIFKEQRTINLKKETNDILNIQGRHDSCIGIRAIPVIECAAAIALTDALYE